MFSNNFGMGFGFMWILWIAVIIAIIWFIKSVASNNKTTSDNSRQSAMEILQSRYVKGDITRDEFKQMSEDLKKQKLIVKHTYKIWNMSCPRCKASIKQTLLQLSQIDKVNIDLAEKGVVIEMNEHLSLNVLQQALLDAKLRYTIEMPSTNHANKRIKHNKTKGTYYCPMFCEGEKTYDMFRNCPVCGMDLIMLEDKADDEQKIYKELLKKFKLSVAFTLPIFIIAMGNMIPNQPLNNIMSQSAWNWMQLLLSLPVVFYTGWQFFIRAYNSIMSWNLNMFTLIGIGTGVAFIFSVFGLLFPDIFPDEFKSNNGLVHLYFESATVILTLVLLGQLLETKAHSKTNTAIKELLNLAPKEAILPKETQEKIIAIDEIR